MCVGTNSAALKTKLTNIDNQRKYFRTIGWNN